MGLLNEETVKIQKLAGIINEDQYDNLMQQIKSDKEAMDAGFRPGFAPEVMGDVMDQIKGEIAQMDQYEKRKAEMYSLNEGLSPEDMLLMMDQIKGDSAKLKDYEDERDAMYALNEGLSPEDMALMMDQIKGDSANLKAYEDERDEMYSLNEGMSVEAMADMMDQIKIANEKLKEDAIYLEGGPLNCMPTNLNEGIQPAFMTDEEPGQSHETGGFKEFLHSEYGESPAPQEVGEAIVNWANNYMTGGGSADFDTVATYLTDDIWSEIKGDISDNYMKEMKQYITDSQSSPVEESNGIKIKDDIDVEMGGIEPSLKEDEQVDSAKVDQVLKTKMDNIFAAAIESLPSMIAKSDTDKNGKLELSGEPGLNEQHLNEVLGLGLVAANIALSAPGIVGLAGKLMKGMGSIPGMNISALKTAGEAVSKFGKDWQAKHMKAIEYALKKLMPNASEKTIERATKAAFITIMATIALSGGVVAGSGAEAVHGAVGVGKTAGAINKVKDFGMQLAKADVSDWKSQLAGLLPAALGKIFN